VTRANVVRSWAGSVPADFENDRNYLTPREILPRLATAKAQR